MSPQPLGAAATPGSHLSRSLALWLLVALCSLAWSTPAAAHTRLTATTPAAGARVDAPLREIRLTFSEAVDAGSVEVLLGDSVVLRERLAAVDAARQELRLVLQSPLGAGAYRVSWRAAAADGHPVHGSFAFTVAAARAVPALQAAPPAAAEGDPQPTDAADEEQGSDTTSPLAVLVRWVGLAGLLLMLGCAAFVLLVLRRVARSPRLAESAQSAARRAWGLALGAAAVSALTLVLRLWQQSVMLNGAEAAWEAESLRGLIGGTIWGAGWRLQGIATVAFVLGLLVARSRHGRGVGWLGAGVAALLVAAVPALSGHAAAVEGPTAIAIIADWLHVLGAAMWLGMLAVLLLAGLPGSAATSPGADAFAAMVRTFSPLALLGAATAGATGTVSAALHLHRVAELWSTGYGQVLLLKLALLAAVAGIGFYNWRFVLPTLHTSASPARLRRSAVAELGIGTLVLLVTAVLVALPPP